MTKHPLADLDAEIRDHIARETQDNIDRGMSPEEARDAAIRRFGNTARVREDARAVWVPAWSDHLRQDVRYALRLLVRDPGFSCAAIFTLAFVIGLTTGVFSVVHSVLLRPLPYADSDRIVLLRETLRDRAGSASAGNFHDWTTQATAFETTAAAQPATFNLTGAGEPERITGMRVTPGYFDVAYMPPAAGRYFTAPDMGADARLAVLGHGFWQRRFAADPAVVGRTLWLSGDAYVVTGVAPPGFALTDPTRSGVVGGFSADIWTTLAFSPAQQGNYGNHAYLVLAKLKAGHTVDSAQADLERITAGIAERHPQEMATRGVDVARLDEVMFGGIRPPLYVLLGAVGFVLIIGCVNIGSLLLARATTRQREIAIRAAIGGGRRRIVRQLLTESLVLAVPGGLGALVVAAATIQYFVVRGPAYLPRLGEAGLQPEVLLFATVITTLAAIASGLAPALRVSRLDVHGALKDTGSGLGSRRQDRLRRLMVAGEVALTVMVLAGAGLLLRSAVQLASVPLGFDAHNVLVARMSLPAARYGDGAAVTDAYRAILSQLRSIPGVHHAAVATSVPLVGGGPDAAIAAEHVELAAGSAPSPHIRLISDGYSDAMGIALVRGRAFQPADLDTGAPSVVLINERLAATVWPGTSAIGKRISTWAAGPEPEWREVVGVVADVRAFGQIEPAPLELFIPYTHAPVGAWNAFQRSMVLVLRTNRDWPETYAAPLRAAVSAIDPSVPLYDVRTMEQVVVGATAARRFYLRLVLLLAATGLGLAVLGVYGVIAHLVSQRRSEIGMRIAIGAQRFEVVRLVVGHGLRMASLGVAIGVPAALLQAQAMRNLLFEVAPTDPLTFTAVVLLLLVTSVLASLLPAARAASVDPLLALRHE